jgi:4a-hydroxytetrahydrobiopterin dehydratase
MMMAMTDTCLTRQENSDGVSDAGWRYVLDTVRTFVATDSLKQAAAVATTVASLAGEDLRLDLRSSGVTMVLPAGTSQQVELARRISVAVGELGLRTEGQKVEALEFAIDTMDADAIRPFWKAVLAYENGPNDLFDPLGQRPTLWFQQLAEPRTQRNRIHFDVSVPHDEAAARIEAALAAGGVLVSDKSAPAFWILADADGNEACICTWQGRD